MNFKEIIEARLIDLYRLHKEYSELERKYHHWLTYRLNGITEQIEILEDILHGENKIIRSWELCIEEDRQELEEEFEKKRRKYNE